MSDMRIDGGSPVYRQEAPARPAAAQEGERAVQATETPELLEREDTCTLRSQGEELGELIGDAKERIEAHKKSLEAFRKNTRNTRYGDAPMEAYSRLARAKTRGQVSAASGYARRRLAQLKAALREDADNAPAIRGAINQLQKAVSRAEKKKRELAQEELLEGRRAKSREKRRQAKRLRHALQRRRTQRTLRESGYLREAAVSGRLHAQLTASQLELRQQAQQLQSAANLDGTVRQYAAAAEAPPAPSISVEA